ncbi:MAG: SDR family oxidoreductase [Longimicrobiales bacterium]
MTTDAPAAAAAASVLVTGASKGIGEATALRLAGAGWQVFAGVRREADGEALQQRGGEAVVPVLLDVTDSEQIAAAAEVMREATGGVLHGVVNNAGMAVAGPLEFLPPESLRRQLDVNVVGQVAVTQAVLPMIRATRGRIVMIGSIAGRSALPFVGPYSASKFALEAIADTLRVELMPWGVHVSLIEPGVIATPIWQTSIDAALAMLEDAPPVVMEYYGERLGAIRRRAERGTGGMPPDVVARAIERALTSSTPRTRYMIGRDAKLRLWLERVLPDRARDRVIDAALERL